MQGRNDCHRPPKSPIMRFALLATACAILMASSASAGPVEAGFYNDEDRLRSGFSADVRLFGCDTHAHAEWFDNDEDYLPDTIPPGGPPPRYDYYFFVC